MEQDNLQTDVIFRKFKDGEIIALMPHDVVDFEGNVNSYMHVGQHGAADFVRMIAKTKPATDAECIDLKREMESFGYKINVCKRINQDKYIASFMELKSRK